MDEEAVCASTHSRCSTGMSPALLGSQVCTEQFQAQRERESPGLAEAATLNVRTSR